MVNPRLEVTNMKLKQQEYKARDMNHLDYLDINNYYSPLFLIHLQVRATF